MKTNIGIADGYIRTLIFLALLCYAIIVGGATAWLAVIPGAVLFATAVLAWCPLYTVLGVNSAESKA